MHHQPIVVLTAFLWLSCKGPQIYLSNKKPDCEDLEKKFLTTAFRCSNQLMIPESILTLLSKETKDNYTFAEYGQDYNNTDITVYPNKRLIFNGVQDNRRTGFIFYERGGIAASRMLLVYERRGETVYAAHFYIPSVPEVETLEGLKKQMVSFHLECW